MCGWGLGEKDIVSMSYCVIYKVWDSQMNNADCILSAKKILIQPNKQKQHAKTRDDKIL